MTSYNQIQREPETGAAEIIDFLRQLEMTQTLSRQSELLMDSVFMFLRHYLFHHFLFYWP